MSVRVCLVALLCAATALPTWAATRSTTLPNGLKIIVREDHRAPVAVAQVWYKIGSVDEEAGKTGLSHVLEHMMFKGTANIPSGEYSKRITALGGELNAYTNRNETVYYQTIAAAHLPEVLNMEADRMEGLSFDNADYTNELEVVKEERRMRTDDSPTGRLYEKLYATAFTQSGHAAPIIGSMDDLNRMSGDDARAWYRKWYAPNNATVIIVGDVDAKKTIKQVKSAFGKLKPAALPKREKLTEPVQTAARAAQLSAPSELPIVALAYQVPQLQKLDDTLPYALDVLADVLDGNAASRMEKNLVRGKQTALSAGASYTLLTRADTVFVLSGAPAAGVDVNELIGALKNEVKNVAEHGVSEQELARTRKAREAAEVFAKDSMSSQASMMGDLESSGFDYRDEDEIRKRLNAVTAADVQQAARFLSDDKVTQVVLYPEALNRKQGQK